MREILFRGKVLRSHSYPEMVGQWVYGHYFEDLVGGELEGFIFNAPTSFCVDPRTVGQFTGMCDARGKMIYEWDVLDGLPGVAQVVFDYGSFAFKSFGSEAIDYDFSIACEKAFVIGNIFEEPFKQ